MGLAEFCFDLMALVLGILAAVSVGIELIDRCK